MTAGCGKKDDGGSPAGDEAAARGAEVPPADAAPPDAGPSREGLTVHTSIRCSECHGKMEGEWKESAHASSWTSELYQRARKAVGARAAMCDRCHAPLAHWTGTGEPAAQEGVTCDVCHNIDEVDMSARRHRFELTVYDMVKYGPMCDLEDHYFHRMGCSELHEESELCGGCHQLTRKLGAGGELPVYTTYADWAAGPYAEDGIACQSCHMPGGRAVVAEGSPPRSGVGHHGFFGGDRPLRQRAAALEAVATAGDDGALAVEVTIRNKGAGHPIPAGSPSRRIALRVVAAGPGGAETDRAEVELGRRLVDDRGAEVPHYLATREGDDNRVPPRGERTERLEVTAPEGGSLAITLVITLIWRSHSDAIAEAIGLDEVDEEVMTSLELSLAKGLPARGAVTP